MNAPDSHTPVEDTGSSGGAVALLLLTLIVFLACIVAVAFVALAGWV